MRYSQKQIVPGTGRDDLFAQKKFCLDSRKISEYDSVFAKDWDYGQTGLGFRKIGYWFGSMDMECFFWIRLTGFKRIGICFRRIWIFHCCWYKDVIFTARK